MVRLMKRHGLILVVFEEDHVRLYCCNAKGVVVDEEHFRTPEGYSRDNAAEQASVIHALVYDSLNYGLNGKSSSNPGYGPEYLVPIKVEEPSMTPEEMQRYGGGLSIWEQLRLLSEWSPLLAFGQKFMTEADQHAKTLVVAEALEWIATKTKATNVDDELVSLLAAILKSPQGEAFVRWCIKKAEAVK